MFSPCLSPSLPLSLSPPPWVMITPFKDSLSTSWEGIIGGKGGRIFRNNYKGHRDKTKGMGSGEGGEMAGVGGSSGGKRQTTIIE